MIASNVITAALVGLLYGGVDTDNPDDLQDTLSALFFVIISVAFLPAFIAVMIFPQQRILFNRERAARSFRISAYLTSLSLNLLWLEVVITIVFQLLFYFTVGLRPGVSAFLWFFVILFILTDTATMTGYLAGAAAPTAELANLYLTFPLLIWIFFSGFFVTYDNIPKWMLWAHYSSFMKYGYEAMIINQFQDEILECRTITSCEDSILVDGVTATLDNGTEVFVDAASLADSRYCSLDCSIDGNTVIQDMQPQDVSKSESLVIMVLVGLALRVALYAVLRWLKVGKS